MFHDRIAEKVKDRFELKIWTKNAIYSIKVP